MGFQLSTVLILANVSLVILGYFDCLFRYKRTFQVGLIQNEQRINKDLQL